MVGDQVGFERLAVHELERPRPDMEDDVVTPPPVPFLDEPAESDVGERTGHVGEDVDDRRLPTLRGSGRGTGDADDPMVGVRRV